MNDIGIQNIPRAFILGNPGLGEPVYLNDRLIHRDYYPYCPPDLGSAHYKNVRPIYRALLAKNNTFTHKEMNELRKAYGMNSYEQDMLICRLDIRSLLSHTEHLYRIGDIQEKRYCPVTYSDAIISRITPLLMKKIVEMLTYEEDMNRDKKDI